MIWDFDQCGWSEMHCDLCIIGAGAAGIAIAREFFSSRYCVIVLEGGGNEVEPLSQEPYRSVISGLPHRGTHEGRIRALGGTTTLWAGQALPLLGIDFEQRQWVPFSGWPISRDDLLPYYRRAEEVMQIPHASYDEKSWPGRERPLCDPDRVIQFCYSQFAEVPNFAHKYRRALATSENITLLTHANAVELKALPNVNAVRSLSIKSFRGKTAEVKAKFYIICCGGIDSARLLLASNSTEPNGIGNRFGVVGRFFQDHPTINVPIKPRKPSAFDRVFGAIKRRSKLHLIKFFPSYGFQRDFRILNIGAEVIHEDADGDPVAAAFRLAGNLRRLKLGPAATRDFSIALRHPAAVGAAIARKTVGQRGRSSARLHHSLLLSCEQEPDPDSRVSLSPEVDCMGMPRAVVHWKLSAMVSHTVHMFLQHVADWWKSSELADINLDHIQISGRETGAHGGYSDLNHHIGTTRMGVNPATSVVDASCRVHGYQNIYIASSSVFSTGGFSNPTLTIIALSCRIADDIKACLRQDLAITVGYPVADAGQLQTQNAPA